MKYRIILFYLLGILGSLLCYLLWLMPTNEYEWMQSDPVFGYPSMRLPIDQDSLATSAVFALPTILLSLANLINALYWPKTSTRAFAIGFSLLLILAVIVKFMV